MSGSRTGGMEPDVALGPLNESFKWFLASLPFSATAAEIKQFFSTFGTVNFVKIIWDNRLQKSKGYGFLYMYDRQGDAEIERFARAHNNRIRLMGKSQVLLQRNDQKRTFPMRDPSKRSHDDHAVGGGAQQQHYSHAPPPPPHQVGAYGPALQEQQQQPYGGQYDQQQQQPYGGQYDQQQQQPYVGQQYDQQQQSYGGQYDQEQVQSGGQYDSYAAAAPMSSYAMGGGGYASQQQGSYYDAGAAQPVYGNMPSQQQQPTGGAYGYDNSAYSNNGGYGSQPYSSSYAQPQQYNGGYGSQQPAMQRPPPPPPARNSTQIFLQNLPVDVTLKDVAHFLSKEHSINVRRCTIEYDLDPNATWCFAHVDVASPADAGRLVEISSRQSLVFPNGQVLQASYDTRPPPDGVSIPVGPRPPRGGGLGGRGGGDFRSGRGRGQGRPPSREGRRNMSRPY